MMSYKKLDAEADKRLQPLIDAADKAARHFVAQIALMVLSMQGNDEQFRKTADETTQAFVSALFKGWLLCLANAVESDAVNHDVICTASAIAAAEGKEVR